MHKISKLVLFIIRFIFYPLEIFFKKNIIHSIYQNLRHRSKIIYIYKKKTIFYVPNSVINWRINTFFTKEPDTLEWIKSFEKNKKTIFWDVGANIGLYTIFAGLVNKNCSVYAFEPSFLNLYFLSKNIFVNKLINRVKIIQTPLDFKKNQFFNFVETSKFEGGAFNSFSKKNNYKNNAENIYNIFGTTAEELIKRKIIKIPNYIKIDVDGNEYKILRGFGKLLKHKNIQEILVEIDEDNKKEKNKIINILSKNGYKIYKKKSTKFEEQSLDNTYNYFFNKL